MLTELMLLIRTVAQEVINAKHLLSLIEAISKTKCNMDENMLENYKKL